MAYEEVKLEDMKWDLELEAFTYECPCGDLFQITVEELEDGEEIAHCPSCSLYVMVDYTEASLNKAKERVASQEGPGGNSSDQPPAPIAVAAA